MSDSKSDLLALLAIASGHAPPAPEIQRRTGDGRIIYRPMTPDEWAAHLMAHAEAIGRAVDAKVAAEQPTDGSTGTEHDPECAPDSCAAGCPDAVRAREDGERRATGRIAIALRASIDDRADESCATTAEFTAIRRALTKLADDVEAGRL